MRTYSTKRTWNIGLFEIGTTIAVLLIGFLLVSGIHYAWTHRVIDAKIIRVMDKIYEPARTYVVLMPMVIDKTTILIPYTMYDDEDWVLVVLQEETLANGYVQRKARRRYVTHDVYDRTQIGPVAEKATVSGGWDDTNNRRERGNKLEEYKP